MLCQFLLYNEVNQIYIYTYIVFFQLLFQYRSVQSIEQSSSCCTVSPYQCSILYIAVCICQPQSPSLSLLPHLPPGNYQFVFYICSSMYAVQLSALVLFFKMEYALKNQHNLFLPLCALLNSLDLGEGGFPALPHLAVSQRCSITGFARYTLLSQ